MADRTIDLLLPGLGWREGLKALEQDPSRAILRRLGSMLSRADRLNAVGMNHCDDPREWLDAYHARLARGCHGTPLNAAHRLLGEGGDPADALVVGVRPVYLRPEQDRLVLQPLDDLLDDAYAQSLVAAFNAHFRESGLKLTVGSPDSWYLIKPPHVDLLTPPLYRVVWRNIQQSLPSGIDGRWWTNLSNETQMLFHGLPETALREEQGLPIVNAIWLEWPGKLSAPDCDWDGVLADEPMSRGLARSKDVPLFALADWSRAIKAFSGRLLVVDDRLTASALARDLDAWLPLAQRSLADLLRGIKESAAGVEWHIDPCAGRTLRYHPAMARRFWRWRRPLSELV